MSDHHQLPATSSTVPTDIAGQRERELLAGVQKLAGDMANRTASVMVQVAVQAVQVHVHALARAAAVMGLDAELAAEVGGRIDWVMRSRAHVKWTSIPFSVSRDQSGKVSMHGLLDVNSFGLAFKGSCNSAQSRDGMPPQSISFSSIAVDLPTPQLVLPPPQIVVNNNPAPASRQVVKRDDSGEIESVESQPVYSES